MGFGNCFQIFVQNYNATTFEFFQQATSNYMYVNVESNLFIFFNCTCDPDRVWVKKGSTRKNKRSNITYGFEVENFECYRVVYGHNLFQRSKGLEPPLTIITCIPFDSQVNKQKEYILFRDRDLNNLKIFNHFQFQGLRFTYCPCLS